MCRGTLQTNDASYQGQFSFTDHEKKEGCHNGKRKPELDSKVVKASVFLEIITIEKKTSQYTTGLNFKYSKDKQGFIQGAE